MTHEESLSKSEGRFPPMRSYECIYILDPTLDEPAVKEKSDRYGEIVSSRNGEVRAVDYWGKRRLAYPIKKFHEGIYTLFKFSGNKEILAELGRVFRFDDAVLRHLIVIDESPPQAEKGETSDSTEE
jgi:small subunit ribosomal protein S6